MTPPFADLPGEVQDLRRYLPWRAVSRPNGRVGKVPQLQQGQRFFPCDPLRPANWLTLAGAWAAVVHGQADGVGLALTPDLGVTALDLDDCVGADGVLSPHAEQLLSLFPAACADLSPSRRGLHLLVRGTLPPGPRRFAGVEVISRGFLTVTGRPVRPPTRAWETEQAALTGWYTRQLPTEQLPTAATACRRPQTQAPIDDRRLLERAFRARSGPTFQALWLDAPGAAPTASEGDLRLVMMLAYWLGSNVGIERLDGLFRQSLRMRPKWDETRGDATYGQLTLRAALRLRAVTSPPARTTSTA